MSRDTQSFAVAFNSLEPTQPLTCTYLPLEVSPRASKFLGIRQRTEHQLLRIYANWSSSTINMLPLLFLASIKVALAAECFSYAVSTVTDCGPPTPTPSPATTTGPVETVTVTMPECHVCNCPSKTYTKVYTTAYELFCPRGVGHQTYTVTELYPGVTDTPVIAHSTACPEGFTTTLATCNACGESPITKTLTVPSGGPTFVSTALPPVSTGTGNQPGPLGTPGQPSTPGQSECKGETCPPLVVAGASKSAGQDGLLLGSIMLLMAWL